MARLILVVAKSGTGKTSSLRNLKKDDVNVISCSGKELPFKTDIKPFMPKNYTDVYGAIKAANAPMVVIDDANYLMSFEEMARSNEIGYAKFTQMANNMFTVFKAITDKDTKQNFYVMAHAAEDDNDTQLRFKTTGKMLSEKVVLEGLTNIMLTTEVSDGEFLFRTKTDGTGVKTPMGMFEEDVIPNDLKLVNERIEAYYA